jgi:signal transduction histidine kinase
MMTLTSKNKSLESPRESFRDLLVTPRFAGPEAFRLHVVVFALAPLTLGSILVDGVPHTSSLPIVSFAAAVSLVVAVVFFVVCGRIINGAFPREGFPRTALTLAVFGATEAIRTTVFSQAILMSNADLDLLLPHRLVGGSMTGMLVMGIVSLLSVDRDRYYADYERLVDRQQALTRELEALNYTISRFIDDLTTNVREVVDTALGPLGSPQRATSRQEVIDRIVDVSENVVRPLSQEVSAALPKVSDQGDDQPRVSLRRVFELTTIVAPFQPVGMPLVIFMLFFSASVFLIPRPSGLLVLSLSLAGVWASHAYGSMFLAPRMVHWPIHWRLVGATAMYSLGSLAPFSVIVFQQGYGTTLNRPSTIIYVVAFVALVSWGLALIPAIREGQREIISDMHATTASLMQVRARNEVRLRRDKQRLASIIHGDIQAILMATALKVQQDNYTADDLRSVIDDTREAIVSSFEGATDRASEKTLTTVQQSLTDFWQGIVSVHWSIEPGMSTVVDANEDLPELLFQVLREALTNAAKHGRASNVHVRLHIDADNRIVCRVSDDGRTVSDDFHAGAGTQFFQAVADSVTFERGEKESVLTLSIPLPQPIQAVSVG